MQIILDKKNLTKKLWVSGRVQAIGFRPFVHNLAKKHNLTGYIRNNVSYVEILLQGECKNIDNFLKELSTFAPSQAKIQDIVTKDIITTKQYKNFTIAKSIRTNKHNIEIAPDIALCSQCENEINDKNNRRYLYPFTNCTNCGPRFTIIKNLPYDRKNTTMKKFKMCKLCQDEYDDYTNRRFHAQPNACPQCGPTLLLKKVDGEKIENVFSKKYSNRYLYYEEIFEFIAKRILKGNIFAVKSYGGYQIMCDATNKNAVQRLREKKYRLYKPFALMAANINIIKNFCIVNEIEENTLKSSQAPIVLLQRKNIQSEICENVAPNSNYLGFMLPYTPLHVLIFKFLEKVGKINLPLIMTSGNFSDEPIIYDDNKAFNYLKNIVDYFITFNRDINVRCDDSVVKVHNNNIFFVRRSRGYAPSSIIVDEKFIKPILAVGAQLKNTFSLAQNNKVVLSQYIGDLDNAEVSLFFEETIKYFMKSYCFKPKVIAHDLHPNYYSTNFALRISKAKNIKLIGIQHHFAHMVSVMADNNLKSECIGVIFDGTGYGLDGNFWGSEFFIGNRKSFKRLAHFDYINLIGADNSVKYPVYNAIGFLYEFFPEYINKLKFFNELTENSRYNLKEKIKYIKNILEKKLNIHKSCGMGRIFDLIAVFLNLGYENNYEGQLPSELEYLATHKIDMVLSSNKYYNYKILEKDDLFIVDTKSLIKEVILDIINETPSNVISAKFHYTIVIITLIIAMNLRKKTKINDIVLSGGSFQNRILLKTIQELLKNNNFNVYNNINVPCNDGGISFGQAIIANNIIFFK